MRRKSFFLFLMGALTSLSMLAGCGGVVDKSDKYTKDGRLIVSMRNLYFDAYRGGDDYMKDIEKQFKLSFKLDAYSWINWSQQVTGQVNGGNSPDVFHANVDSYNFKNTYLKWAEDKVTKPLPTDLSKWPNLKAMLENTTNIKALKVNGKLYGIPIAKNTTDYSTSFSPFTYMYRRDWAKQYGVYQENDEYTWEQFKALLDKFAVELKSKNCYALGDEKWGYPSIVNFYKQVPHCFAYDEKTGQYVNNYTTKEYIAGLEESHNFMQLGRYYPSENTANDSDVTKLYYGNKVGVLYENFSYSNYYTIKTKLKKSNVSVKNFNVDDAVAIMKVRGPDGKYALEGTDNWFSMTFFDYRISDEKQEKILDLLDWLLGEEGTMFSVFGFEGYDYELDKDGKPQIIDSAWPKDKDTGEIAPKDNGAKYLRYLVSLGYDTLKDDPLTDKESIARLDEWDAEMKEALENDELKVLKEREEVMWLTTNKKSSYSGTMRTDALKYVRQYISGTIKTIEDYEKKFGYPWSDVLEEINDAIGRK